MKKPEVKCIVWDLDDTLWEGILLEVEDVKLNTELKEIIHTLDSRGILHSIASKNDYDTALTKLRDFGLEKYFLYPEINWNAKSESISNIQKNLNIAMESIMFIDDNPFERDEVRHTHPEVECIDAVKLNHLLKHPRLNPRFITKDSQSRRLMYLQDMERKKNEVEYQGPKAEFLALLNMRFSIGNALEEDLKRAEELTIRTHQLNTTGKTYDYEDLKNFVNSKKHKLLISDLKDKYGSHGKIGLALIEISKNFWHLKLFLMSCRVMSYGVGTAFLSYIMHEAKKEGKRLRVDFKPTDRNRMMYVTFKFANFKEIMADESGQMLLENELSSIQNIPPYIELIIQ